jgi:alkylated DNA repair dioxygenase AlkB
VARQPTLFSSEDAHPPGFQYRAGVISEDEERALVRDIERLEFARVEMRGVVARRRTAHFGMTYGYERRTTEAGTPIPVFLLPLRERVASWAGINPEDLVEALVTEYPAGASIGWHRDAPMFGDVIAGVSLISACRMKFRPYVSPSNVRNLEGPRRTTHEIELPPRSGYLITGRARREFEHSIPHTSALRYSITFRNLR